MSEKKPVAEMVKEEGKDNVWRCLLCDRPPGPFLSVMIAHLMADHGVRSLEQEENTGGRLLGTYEGGGKT